MMLKEIIRKLKADQKIYYYSDTQSILLSNARIRS